MRLGAAAAAWLVATSRVDAAIDPPTGTWQSVGYGMVWEFEPAGLQIWELTRTTCVRGARLPLASATPPDAAAAYLDGAATAWIIRPRRSATELVAHSPGTVADVHLRSVGAVPARCRTPPPNTAAGTFTVFAETMAEQYAFFRLRGVDWPAAVQGARGKVDNSSPRDFYQLLASMVAPLEDRHTDVTATDLELRQRNVRRSGGPIDAETFPRLKAVLPRRSLRGPVESWCQDWIQYAELADSVAYLRVMREYTYTPSGRFEDDSTALTRALDSILPRIGRHRGLVLDVRLNGGGADAISLLIASRFTESRYLAFGKQTRSDPVVPTRFTPLQQVWVEPSPGPRFTGPMVLLTGPYTLSAGEVLTLALLPRKPSIVRVGQATQGIFADELIRQLPNGWRFQLSTERYLTPSGRSFEAVGIPPDREVPVFAASDLTSGRDPAVELALELLSKRR